MVAPAGMGVAGEGVGALERSRCWHWALGAERAHHIARAARARGGWRAAPARRPGAAAAGAGRLPTRRGPDAAGWALRRAPGRSITGQRSPGRGGSAVYSGRGGALQRRSPPRTLPILVVEPLHGGRGGEGVLVGDRGVALELARGLVAVHVDLLLLGLLVQLDDADGAEELGDVGLAHAAGHAGHVDRVRVRQVERHGVGIVRHGCCCWRAGCDGGGRRGLPGSAARPAGGDRALRLAGG
jgi:hypothetical protein